MTPIHLWNSLLEGVDTSAMCTRLSARMRERRLRFGDRVICPFLRPFFLDAADEARVRGVAEMLWTLGERVASQAVADAKMLADLALSGELVDAGDEQIVQGDRHLVVVDEGHAFARLPANLVEFVDARARRRIALRRAIVGHQRRCADAFA